LSIEYRSLEAIKEYPKVYFKILNKIINEVKEELNNKREVMFSDIINFIIRKKLKGEKYTKLIIWCNYNMRIGEVYLKI